jgi:two-component system, chemotaxis family, chemotaxis protein CheY
MPVLVIDDSRATRAFIGGILREMNLDFVEAENGQEALERLHNTPDITLALVDWNMPVMDGLEFIQAVRADREFSHVKLVMVTTESESEQMNRAMAAGANEYVMKPFTMDVLAAKLAMMDLFGD